MTYYEIIYLVSTQNFAKNFRKAHEKPTYVCVSGGKKC